MSSSLSKQKSHKKNKQQQQQQQNQQQQQQEMLLTKIQLEQDEVSLMDNLRLSKNKNNNNNNISELDQVKHLLKDLAGTLNSQHREILDLKQDMLNQQKQQSQFTPISSNANNDNNNNGSDNSNMNNLLSMQQQFMQTQLLPKVNKMIKEEIHSAMQSQQQQQLQQQQQQQHQRLFDPLREQLSREIADKLKSIEYSVKESVSKLLKSKSVMDAASQSISQSMQATIVNSYRDTFQKVIVPNFEKSCQVMYSQVNSSFANGTQDYLREFDQLARQHRKQFADENPQQNNNSKESQQQLVLVAQQINKLNEQIHSQSQKLATEMAQSLQAQFEQQIRSSNAVLQDTIISSVKAIIKEEMQVAMREQYQQLPDRLVMHMRQSATGTPVMFGGGNASPNGSAGTATAFNSNNNSNKMNSSSNNQNNNNSSGRQQQQQQQQNQQLRQQQQQQDVQMKINEYLDKNQLNGAFQLALCASDLNLLVAVCERVEPSKVFAAPASTSGSSMTGTTKNSSQCQLQQPVILSLIQQLSQEMTAKTDLKVKYLEEAIVNLDLDNPLSREHTPSVITQLIMKLQAFIQNNPTSKHIRQLKVLLMCSEGFLNSVKQQQQRQ